MESEKVDKWMSRLGSALGCLYLALGVAELIAKKDDPVSLLFWLSALWGGAALVLAGVFLVQKPIWLSSALVITGLAGATLATAWTVIVPLAALALGVLVLRRSQQRQTVL